MDDLFGNECEILRWRDREPTADNHYEPTADFVPVCSGVRYSLQVKGGTEEVTIGGQQVVFEAVGYFPFETSLRAKPGGAENDRIRDTSTCATYQVVAVFDQTGHGEFLKALLKASA